MFRRSAALSFNTYGFKNKYPALVSYNKVPWLMLAADSPQLHKLVTGHYAQLLKLASLAPVPHLLVDGHPDHISASRHLYTLPSTIYIVPGVGGSSSSTSADGSNPFAPFGWAGKAVEDSVAMQYYAQLEGSATTTNSALKVRSVVVFKSDDLRLICNAVSFEGGSKIVANSNSTLAQMAAGTSNVTGASGSSLVTLPDFTLYHYFRPNRAPQEMTRPFEKFYRFPAETQTAATVADSVDSKVNGMFTKVNLSVFTSGGGGEKPAWSPVFETPVERSKKIPNSPAGTLTPFARFTPPTSYLPPLPERLAISPGGCFGRRDHQWGTYF